MDYTLGKIIGQFNIEHFFHGGLGSSNDGFKNSDEDGTLTKTDLPPGDTATLNISIPGFFTIIQTVDVVKGENQVGITLERDPFGVLGEDTFATGETLTFVEDFQEKTVQGWNNLDARLQACVPNLGIISDPNSEWNLLLLVSSPGENSGMDLGQFETRPFGEGDWRMNIKSWNNMHFHAQWHNDNLNSQYIAFIYGEGENAGRLE